MYLSPDQTGLKIYYSLLWAGIGLKIDPDLSSDKITASWNAGGDAIGSGSVTYNMPNTNYYFGPMTANDYSTATDYANIRLYNYNYYFSICKLTLGANVQAGLTFIDLRIQSGYIDIYNYNCGGVIGDLHIGTHQGTNADSVTGYGRVLGDTQTITVTGYIESGVEGGCTILHADNGSDYDLIYEGTLPPIGSYVSVTGTIANDAVSYCMQG